MELRFIPRYIRNARITLRMGWHLLRSRTSRSKGARKRHGEIAYWTRRAAIGDPLAGSHYEEFYTDHFGISKSQYDDKRLLDIGCGPRGSLEWADNAAECVGIDPLADVYLTLGAEEHEMDYVASGGENIPYPDKWFDAVFSYNSLDHVDDLDDTISEIKRVTNQDGLFLLITDVNHPPTVTEPVSFSWDVLEQFEPEFIVESETHYEKDREGVFKSVKYGAEYDHNDPSDRYGVLSAKLRKTK